MAAPWDDVQEAVELLREGDEGQAESLLRDALGRNPQNEYAHNLLGTLLYSRGDMESARQEFQRATEIAPEYLAAQLNLSECLRHLGETDLALSAANRALEIRPEDDDATYQAGMAHGEHGDIDAAIRLLELFLGRKPKSTRFAEVEQELQQLYQRRKMRN